MNATATRRPTVAAVAIAAAAILAPAAAAAAPPATREQTVAIGDPITVSGTGCLFDSRPASVAFGLYRPEEPDRVAYFTALVTAAPDGTWTVTATIPTSWSVNAGRLQEPVRPGTYHTLFTCWDPPDPTDPGTRKEVPGDTDLVHVTDPGAIPSPTEPRVDPPEAAAPVPARAAPRFTG
jgi:hypothetical protein